MFVERCFMCVMSGGEVQSFAPIELRDGKSTDELTVRWTVQEALPPGQGLWLALFHVNVIQLSFLERLQIRTRKDQDLKGALWFEELEGHQLGEHYKFYPEGHQFWDMNNE